MATITPPLTIWGYVTTDGSTSGTKVKTQSGNLTVSPQSDKGYLSVSIDNDPFSETPAIVATCVSSSDMAPIVQVSSITDPNHFTIVTRDAKSGDRDWRDFMIVIVGNTG